MACGAERFIDVNLTPTSPRGGAVALTDKLSELHHDINASVSLTIRGKTSTNEPRKKRSTYFPLNPGCFIGILTYM